MGGCPEGNQHCLVRQLLLGGHYSFFRQRWKGYSSWQRGLGKIWGLNKPSFIGSYLSGPIPVFRTSFPPGQCPHFHRGHPGRLGIQFALWLSHGMRPCVWFSEISTLKLQWVEVSFKEDIESLKLFMWSLCWEFKTLSSSFSFSTFYSSVKGNKSVSLHYLVWLKCPKIANTCSLRALPSIDTWLEYPM